MVGSDVSGPGRIHGGPEPAAPGDCMRDPAEALVEERVGAALPVDARAHANVRILARTRATGPAHDGEADLVVLQPDHGLLVIEVKGGEPGRDAQGRWYAGGRRLDRSPFAQAEAAKHDLVRAVEGLPEWPPGRSMRAGHAVAFPHADLASLPRGHVLLGPDADRSIVLDAAALESPAATRAALERIWEFWTGDGSKGSPLEPPLFAAVDAYLSPTVALRRLVRRDVEDAKARLVAASNAQLYVLNLARSLRRVAVVGPAGSGKSLVAVEKARRLAREGFRTLYLCFNAPLATSVLREVAEDDRPVGLRPVVHTFHGLCETLGRAAGTLPPKPPGSGEALSAWFASLPAALDAAIARLPGERFHAIVVDEGQDFEAGWLQSLEFLFRTPEDGVLWVFHDPGQALYRDDQVDRLTALTTLSMPEDFRSPAPVAELAAHFYHGPEPPLPYGQGGSEPVIEAVAPGPPTVDAVRRHLHRLVHDEGVRAWDVAVLSGTSSAKSLVWRQRRFGNLELWNGAVDADGVSLGYAAEDVPDEPKDDGVVLFETVRRFKGLERPVVILCELPEEGRRVDELVYTALTRSTAHLVVIAPAALAARLTGARPGGAAPVTRKLARGWR